MHLEVLTLKQRKILSQLGFTKKHKMYLAGGTALALQVGHRTSVHFDFYTNQHFKKSTLLKIFKNNLKNLSIKVLRDVDDTFEIQINNLHLSCFYYPYSLVGKLVNIKGIQLASIEDISAMKVVAISQRGRQRDFIDIYYLINKLGLDKIISITEKKYPELDRYNALRGLLYFSDADKDREISRIKTSKDISWQKIKKFIQNQAKQYQIKQFQK